MHKNWIKLTVAVALLAGSSLALTTTADAKATYQMTDTQTVTPKPYHITNPQKALYSWDKTHTKRMANLASLEYLSWFVIEKDTMIHSGKTTTYFKVADSYGTQYGYVYAKGLTKGFDPKDDEKLAYKPETKVAGTAKIQRVSEAAFAKATPTLTKNTYYRTTKQVKLTAGFTPYFDDMGSINKTVTLPKGTVVEAHRFYNQYNNLAIGTNYLSRNILSPGYQQNLWVSSDGASTSSAAKINAFTKTKRPAYLPKNGSHGDFYLGGVTALKNKNKALSKQSVQITSNGYVEVRKNNPAGKSTEYRAKPTASVKIQRTTVKGHTRYLYLAKSLKGFKTTKVTYHGKKQYRLSLVNQLKTYAEPNYSEEWDLAPSYYGLMSLGGKTFYTPYGATPEDH
ncbi:hypothetical protein [Levilactobacillus wangkuiensis]|uniref:hypothetical protein n=1 Tax=Levilactobacillus wangkuiensis TaxID=2799566 RepID=UPI00194530F7|nr:hypothetical protein [Levilactobacillus wangkuiensis]